MCIWHRVALTLAVASLMWLPVKDTLARSCPPEEAVGYLDAEGPSSGTIVAVGVRPPCVFAVTAWHVVREYPPAWLAQHLVRSDPEHDLALLKFCQTTLPACVLPLADRAPERGATVRVIGYPEGLMKVSYLALVGPQVKLENGREYVVLGLYISPGMSGGAVVDDRGRLIGVAQATYGINVPISLISTFEALRQLLQGVL